MITTIKVFVKIIKLFVVFFKITDGPLSELIEKLEEKYDFEIEEE